MISQPASTSFAISAGCDFLVRIFLDLIKNIVDCLLCSESLTFRIMLDVVLYYYSIAFGVNLHSVGE